MSAVFHDCRVGVRFERFRPFLIWKIIPTESTATIKDTLQVISAILC